MNLNSYKKKLYHNNVLINLPEKAGNKNTATV